MLIAISVMSGEKVVFHTTEDFSKKEYEKTLKTKSLTEKRLNFIIETLKIAHKDFDLSMITNIMVSDINGEDKMYSCEKTLKDLRDMIEPS